MAYEDEDDDGADDPELPDEADMDQDDGDEFAETVPCPHCGKPLYEQAEFCPHCRSYISVEEARRRKPLWLVIGVILCIVIILIAWAVR